MRLESKIQGQDKFLSAKEVALTIKLYSCSYTASTFGTWDFVELDALEIAAS